MCYTQHIMTWFVFALISIVTLSISRILQRVLMKDEKSDNVTYSIVFQLLCAFLLLIFAFFTGFKLPPIQEYSFNFIVLTIGYAAATVFLFKALKTTFVSEVTILMTSSSLWTIIVAFIFLKESFDIQKAIGTFLIISSIILIAKQKKEIKKYINKGALFALLSAFFFGITMVNDGYIINQAKPDINSYTAIAFLFPGIALLLLNLKSLPKIKHFTKPKKFTNMLFLSIAHSISAITFYFAYKYGGTASQLSPISQSSIIVTTILAVLFLKERQNLIEKIIAAILVSIGVILLK